MLTSRTPQKVLQSPHYASRPLDTCMEPIISSLCPLSRQNFPANSSRQKTHLKGLLVTGPSGRPHNLEEVCTLELEQATASTAHHNLTCAPLC